MRNSYDIQVEKQFSEEDGSTTKEEIQKGIKDGVIEGTKDYLMSYYDALESLKDISFNNILDGVGKVRNFVSNPKDSLTGLFNGFKETINGIYEKLLVLTGYEKAKGGSYVGTNISLSYADPGGKILTFAGGGFFIKIGKKVDGLMISRLQYSDKILGQMNTRGWAKSDIENTMTYPYKVGKSTDNYNGKSDPATAFFVSDNQYVVINNKTGDIVQVSDKNDPDWLIDARIYDIK